MEIPIVATGARPGGGAGPRELFCEDTTTVLVFEKGAVIRLSAAVVPGQLIFLTNIQSKREVVAQVMLKRSSQPTSCYAELQFSEDTPAFWGPDLFTNVASSATAPLHDAVEEVHSAEIVGDHPTLELAAPTLEEVDRLKEEVELLRQKLQSVTEAQATHAPEPPLVQPQEISASPDSASVLQPEQPPARLPAITLPKAVEKVDLGSAPSTDSDLGSLVHQEGHGHDALLPETSLDFSGAPPAAKKSKGRTAQSAAGKTQRRPASSDQRHSLRTAVLAMLLLICAACAAWYQHWLPQAISKKLPEPEAILNFHRSSAPSAKAFLPKPKAAPAPATKSSTSTLQPVSSTVPASVPPPDEAKPVGNSAPVATESAKPDTPADNPTDASLRVPIEEKPSIHNEPRSRSTRLSRGSAPAIGRPIVPPRLLKSIRPVAPANAIRSYVTGNVELNALVDAEGRVKSASVISGPEALRDAAISTVKQYKYAPATQSGRPVAAHIDVTVQFWYEP
jgi:TonB family protein